MNETEPTLAGAGYFQTTRKMWARPSASSACRASSAGRGPISSASAW